MTTVYHDSLPAFTTESRSVYLIFSVQPVLHGTLQVMFEGIVGKNYQSDISIDDFSLIPGGCTGGSVSWFGHIFFVCGSFSYYYSLPLKPGLNDPHKRLAPHV